MAKPIPTPLPDEVKARFWAKVNVRGPDECWEWVGARSGGYGHQTVAGSNRCAIRLAWEIEYGERLPSHIHVCHKCDNPPCVNPAHLFAGDRSANMRDMVAKGRHNYRRRTECAHGHPYDEKNTYVDKIGRRLCRACAARRTHSYLQRRRASQ